MNSYNSADLNSQAVSPSDNKLLIEAWSDVACPWCWIGWVRLERALKEFVNRDQVMVVPRSFRLMPGVSPMPLAKYFTTKVRMTNNEVSRVLQHVETVAASEGLHYRLAGTLTGDTLDAHRLIQLAKAQGKGHEMLVRFYRARLSEQTSVFDHDSLLSLAVEAGLGRAAAQAVLQSDAFRAEVEGDQRALQALGGSGVPFFRIGGKYTISGAQPQEVFTQVLRQAWDEQPVIVAQGTLCAPNGCTIP